MLEGAPPGFLLGAATSAYQIEGGNHNDWTEWEGRLPGRTSARRRGATATRAADSWNYWRADLRVAAPRRQHLPPGRGMRPARAGARRLGQAAVARYREMFAGLRAAGITPIVTLYDFTLPLWVSSQGGWDWAGAPAALAAFPVAPAAPSAISSTGGAPSTSRTCWWRRAICPRNGRRGCGTHCGPRAPWLRSCARTAS